ncbi:hypothetical protein Mterra_03463 [Calidithermus terrae]|uniref:TrbC/VIRB2 family protein n=1 Tax=Calidithermus terrae TaxID=1408545 RepID=A0A399EET9_9DEIN|nr:MULTISPECIES: hypothetical protein [Calidithermus]RIH80712.1 hypothetical protein Mterra_03463 [Calidithermus terrae]
MNRRIILLLALLGLLAAGAALAQGGVETAVGNKAGAALCPFINILTGAVGRLVIVVLLAVAAVSYFAWDARAGKAMAITLALGGIVLLNFNDLQKLVTQIDYSTAKPPGNNRIVIDSSGNTTVYCGS